MTKATHSLFCDETGNTGSRFLDPAQPIYAEGGWFIAHKHVDAVANAVVAAERTLGASATERKGAELVRRPGGQAFLRQVCEAAGMAGAVPFIIVVEKRYAVCTKIVETFLDPDYNPQVAVSETWDPAKRQADAEMFYARDDSLVQEFAEAYRLMDGPRLKTNAQNWVTLLRACRLPDQAERVAGVLPNLERSIEIDRGHLASGWFPAGMDSLNVFVVSDVLQFVEQHCPYPCDIVHDQTASFEPLYQFVFGMYSKGDAFAVEMRDGRRVCAGFKNALSLSFQDSKLSPTIRAADYLLAGTRKFIQLALAGQDIPEPLTHVALAAFGTLLLGAFSTVYPSIDAPPELARIMASRSWTKKVFMGLQMELPKSLGGQARLLGRRK